MPRRGGRQPRPKACPFRAQGIEYIDYKDLQTLKRYLNERGKIRAPRSTGVSPQYQRMLAQAIKNAREMALLPYSVR